MKNNNLLSEKQRKIKKREQNEIARLEKEAARPKSKWYIFYMLFIICIIYIADELVTQIDAQMQNELGHYIYAPLFGEDNAIARMGVFAIITYIGAIGAIFWRPLSDKWGRKLFLIANAFGLGIAALIIGLLTNIPGHIIGATLVMFFTPHDMQVIYIAETVPKERRASYYSVIKAIATVGVMLIPALRSLFMNSDTSKWNYVYLAVAVVAAAGALLGLLFARETDPFIKSRLAYLKKTDEEREEDKKQQTVQNAQGGLKNAFKLTFKHKQILFTMLSYGLIYCGIVLTTYYSTTLSYGYSQIFTEQGMDLISAREAASKYVTEALYLFPIGSAVSQLIFGFLSDHFGRKKTIISASCLCITGYVLFYIGTRSVWNSYFVGILLGLAIGSLWAAGDSLNMILMESTPTNLRSSVETVNIFAGLIFTIAEALQLVFINIFGDSAAGLIGPIIAIPPMIAGIMLLTFKVKETKHADMESVEI